MHSHHQLLRLWDDPGEAVSSRQLRDTYKQCFNLAEGGDFDSRFRLLISSGLVERAGSGWKLSKRGVKERKRQPELPLKAMDRHEQPQMPEAHRPQREPPRHPDTQVARSTVTIGRNTSRDELARLEGERTSPSSPDCDVFRRLLAYYIDCVRMDERPRTVLYGNDYNRRFISLPIGRRWWAKSANEEIEVETRVIESQSQFVRQVAQSEGEELFVGYPLYIKGPRNDDQASLIAPIFCIPASVAQDGLTLKLTLDFADADVNAEWLKYQFRTNDVRRAFLQQCGLLDPWPDDDDDKDSTAMEDFLNLESGAVAVRTFCGDKLVGGRIAPEHLRPIADFEHVEPGIHNGAVLYAAKRLRYSAGLLKELRTILNRSSDDDLRRSALRHLFALRAPRSPEETDDASDDDVKPVPFLQFNHEQEKAVEAALTNGLTVITGPPGTGKSQVGANIIANLAIRGRTAVFASRNHKAIDAVVPRTNNLVQEGTVIHRANNTATGESFTWQDAIRQLLAQPPTPPVAQDEYRRLEDDMRRLLDRRGHLLSVAELWTTTERELGQAVEEWDRETDLLPADIVTGIVGGKDLANERTLNAIGSLAKAYPDPLLPLWKRLPKAIWWHLRCRPALRRRLVDLKRPFATYDIPPPPIRADKDLCDALSAGIGKLREYLNLHVLHTQVVKLQQRARALDPLDETLRKLEELLNVLGGKTTPFLEIALLQRYVQLTPEDRTGLTQMRGVLGNLNGPAVNAQTRLRWERFFTTQLGQLLRFFPIWAVTNLSVRRCLPLAPAVVDTVIIDEASQCDIASIIPLLYRARHAVIIGDPNQLQPVHRLQSGRNQQLLLKRNLLDHSYMHYDFLVNSCFQIAACSVDPIQLRDHYRSHESIIGYCNEAFYRKTLRIETYTDALRVPHGWRVGIHWTKVIGTAEGVPPSGAICEEEIKAIGDILSQLCQEPQFDGTVGVVTPFKQQAMRIGDWAERNISARTRDQWRFVSATADGFQGDERDVIICSVVLQPGLPRGSRWRVCSSENQNVWNVAISRARALLHVVGNPEMCLASGARHLEVLARQSTPPPQEAPDSGFFESPWEKRFYDALVAEGITPQPQYSLAGKRLDLALPDVKLDIEVDGERYHRDQFGRRKAEDLWRDIAIKGAGWTPLRFWVYELREDMPRCVRRVQEAIDSADQRK